MINSKFLFRTQALAIIIIGGLFFISCGSNNKEIPKHDANLDLTKDIAYDVTIIISQKAQTQTVIKSPLLVRNENIIPSFAEMPEGLEAEFFNDSGLVTTNLTADYARYYEREQNVILQKNVVVINADSTILKTEELIWNNRLEKFYSDKPVHIDRKGHIITGTGLEANKDLTEVKIMQQKSVIPLEDTSNSQTSSPTSSPADVTVPSDTSRREKPQIPNLKI